MRALVDEMLGHLLHAASYRYYMADMAFSSQLHRDMILEWLYQNWEHAFIELRHYCVTSIDEAHGVDRYLVQVCWAEHAVPFDTFNNRFIANRMSHVCSRDHGDTVDICKQCQEYYATYK